MVVIVCDDSHGQDGRPTADVENDLVLEKMLVLHNGIHVRPCPDFIFLYGATPRKLEFSPEAAGPDVTYKHLLVDPWRQRATAVSRVSGSGGE